MASSVQFEIPLHEALHRAQDQEGMDAVVKALREIDRDGFDREAAREMTGWVDAETVMAALEVAAVLGLDAFNFLEGEYGDGERFMERCLDIAKGYRFDRDGDFRAYAAGRGR